jgi:hypothetical protein
MEQLDLLKHACALLDRLGVRYMVTGSQATIAYGEPRFTNDIDIVAALDEQSLTSFCEGFPGEDFYLSREAASQAVRDRGMFNIIHPSSGLKIDVIIPKQSGYDDQRLDRAVRLPIDEGFDAKFTTPEDIILKKLEWHEMGGGERHLRDIAGILKVRGADLDLAYIHENARNLHVEDLWQSVLHITQGS